MTAAGKVVIIGEKEKSKEKEESLFFQLQQVYYSINEFEPGNK